jgi:hypothetical protein
MAFNRRGTRARFVPQRTPAIAIFGTELVTSNDVKSAAHIQARREQVDFSSALIAVSGP